MLSPGSTAMKPEILCLGYSMQMTFNPCRLNRNSCCVCGSIMHSHFINIGSQRKVVLNASEALLATNPFSGAHFKPHLEKCIVQAAI